MTEIVRSLIIAAIFLVIFVIAELWRTLFHGKVEHTRKFVHFSCGLAALTFSYIFQSHWSVLALCIAFSLIIIISKRRNLLQSIHGVERITQGGIYHPIAIYLTFLLSLYMNQPLFYVIAILVLSVSDAFAALVGVSYGVNFYKVEKDLKSWEGSIIFFLCTFLIVHISLLLFTETGRVESVLIGLYAAIMVTIVEAISFRGTDNLFVPLVTIYVLYLNFHASPQQLGWQFPMLIGSIAMAALIIKPGKKFGNSGVVTLALFGYTVWAMISWTWTIPLLIGIIIVSYTDFFVAQSEDKDEKYRVLPVFYMLIPAFIIIAIANFAVDVLLMEIEHVFFVPYTICFTSRLVMLWALRRKRTGKWGWANIFVRTLVITAVFSCSLFLIPDQNILLMTLMIFAGTFMIQAIFFTIAGRQFDKRSRPWLLRTAAITTVVVTLGVAAANYYLYQLMGL